MITPKQHRPAAGREVKTEADIVTARMRHLYERELWSLARIAQFFDCNKYTVHYRLRHLPGFKFRGRGGYDAGQINEARVEEWKKAPMLRLPGVGSASGGGG